MLSNQETFRSAFPPYIYFLLPNMFLARAEAKMRDGRGNAYKYDILIYSFGLRWFGDFMMRDSVKPHMIFPAPLIFIVG